MYTASKISLQVEGKTILSNASVAVTPGIFTAVVGPNGAGKSSLLKVISNEYTAYQGHVQINGKDVKAYDAGALCRLRAVMAQHSNLQFAFTAYQVVTLGRFGHLATRNENECIVEEVMDVTSVNLFRDRNYLTLSGGEKQRVQLARVLAQVWEATLYPRYILLDEPTSNMDIAQQQFMFSLVKDACRRNIGVLAIVHDLNLAAQFADHLYFMKDGTTTSHGEAQSVFTKENIEETFCCRVNVYRDPCNNCPFIIPERTPWNGAASEKLAINKR